MKAGSIAAFSIVLAGLCPAAREGSEPVPRPVWTDGRATLLGGPSPDGRYLSFVDRETGDLAVRDLASGTERRLTHNDPRHPSGQFAYFSVISPDTHQVAYAWFNEQKFYDLRVIAMDGSAPRLLYRNEEAGFVQPSAWSPDGKFLLTLFFRKDNISQIALVSLADGSVRVLKSLDWVYPKKMDLSPDGRYIVYDNFAYDGASQRDLFVLAADGSSEMRLVEGPGNDLFPVWAPDGNGILFASDRGGSMDLWYVPVIGGKTQGPAQLVRAKLGRFLPLGITRKGMLYYGLRTGLTDVVVAEFDASAGRLGKPARATLRYPGRNVAPEWSPDGQSLAYLSRRGSENFGQESRAICIVSFDGGTERELSPRLAYLERMRWSPDGKSLLVSGSDNKGRGGLYLVDAHTGRTTLLVRQDAAGFRGLEGIWSKNGKTAWYAWQGTIVRREVAGEGERVVNRAPEKQAIGNLALSPGGDWLAFTQGPWVEVMPAAGGDARQIYRIPDGEARSTVWLPSGDALLCSTGTHTWRVSLGGKAELLDFPGTHGDLRIAPGGKCIAFTAGSEKAEIWSLEVR